MELQGGQSLGLGAHQRALLAQMQGAACQGQPGPIRDSLSTSRASAIRAPLQRHAASLSAQRRAATPGPASAQPSSKAASGRHQLPLGSFLAS